MYKNKIIPRIAAGFFLLGSSLAESENVSVFECKLLSENYMGRVDYLDFKISNPSLPNPTIIGANGSAPLEAVDAPNSKNYEYFKAFKEVQGHLYIFYRYKKEDRLVDNAFRVLHLRWGKEENAFEGLCFPS
ncbi:hypothetical protein [Microbulbifer sp. Q7]|uniref:hypothetical protein n=1 Tax=Microbulbifer sp. Q7 TaxID=1785091 RepID=UPI0012906B9B|nr:hypothetical protein [Microbulbifer sp. Q7]